MFLIILKPNLGKRAEVQTRQEKLKNYIYATALIKYAISLIKNFMLFEYRCKDGSVTTRKTLDNLRFDVKTNISESFYRASALEYRPQKTSLILQQKGQGTLFGRWSRIFLFFTHYEVVRDLLHCRCTVKWNLLNSKWVIAFLLKHFKDNYCLFKHS